MDEKMSDALMIFFMIGLLAFFGFLCVGIINHWNKYCDTDYNSFYAKAEKDFINKFYSGDLNLSCFCLGNSLRCTDGNFQEGLNE